MERKNLNQNDHPEEAGPPEQYLQFIHERHDETGAGPTPELPRTPEPYAGFPSVNSRPPDSENRYGHHGSPVSNNSPSPESMGGAAVEDPTVGGAEVPEAYTV